MSDSRKVLAAHLESGRYLAGVARGRWQTLASEFPSPVVSISARDVRQVVLRFECSGYPERPPTATVWDRERNQRLPGDRWPRGGRVSQVFNPGWKGGAALYIPCDRESIEGHPNWYAEYPWLIWRPDVGLVLYVEAIHEVLQSHELISEAA
jgi:hypothetical protein